jgi:hypothetical protein
MPTGHVPAAHVNFFHPLLRARDWPDRPELGDLCDWWRGGGAGLCTLVGIGGAGKTAITDRLLQVLPDHPQVPKRSDLRTPERLLVFSFYDAHAHTADRRSPESLAPEPGRGDLRSVNSAGSERGASESGCCPASTG